MNDSFSPFNFIVAGFLLATTVWNASDGRWVWSSIHLVLAVANVWAGYR